MIDFVLRQRSTLPLVFVAACVGLVYVAVTFQVPFLAGYGPFWNYPVGPWLADSGDTQDNGDILDYLIAYTGFVRSPWHLPLFHVAAIGAPTGTSVVFLDVIPIAALIGRVVSEASGTFILPYGAWTGACFFLAPVFAALMAAEAGQRSLLAAVAAAILAVSAPTLLHRFGHLPLLAHFMILGALYFYLREQRPLSRRARLLFWIIWLALALLTNPYMFAMVSAIYAASVWRSWRVSGITSRLPELALVGSVIAAMLIELGFVGSEFSLSGEGYGLFSMNLLSPFVPQRSGIFPAMDRIIDSTGGQYEGFSYLGLGGLALLVIAMLADPTRLRRTLFAHRELAIILVVLTLFAASTDVWVGDKEILNLTLDARLARLVGIYRSSGRMFWPVYYVLLIGSLIFVLGRVPRSWRLPVVCLCCTLQLIDTEPLRARITTLISNRKTPLLDQREWSDRIAAASSIEIYPSFFCASGQARAADLELQLLAIRVDRSFNAPYNPRNHPNCDEEAARALAGPWDPSTLYVFLDGRLDGTEAWAPAGLACNAFKEGKWCLDRAQAAVPARSPSATRPSSN